VVGSGIRYRREHGDRPIRERAWVSARWAQVHEAEKAAPNLLWSFVRAACTKLVATPREFRESVARVAPLRAVAGGVHNTARPTNVRADPGEGRSALSQEEHPEGIAVPIVWNAPEEVPILVANAFVSQFDRDGSFIVTIGQMTPPALVGTPDEVEEQARQVNFVPVKPFVRLGLSRARLEELIAILQANLEQSERARTMGGEDPR
jgi:hypothetical protein